MSKKKPYAKKGRKGFLEDNPGRESPFKEEYCKATKKLCLLGATDKDLADFFEVSEATIGKWKNKYPMFLESIKEGKEVADSTIAQKLYHRAKGYEHPEDKIFLHRGKPVIVPTIKHYPPDSTSLIFWLKNRRSKDWRDKHEVEHSGEMEITELFKKLDKEDDPE